MTDNFDIIKDFVSKNILQKGDFYFIQILKRRKENPDLKKDVSIIENFFFYSLDDFDKYKEQIIYLCQENNARAYIRINKRNETKIALQTIRIAIEEILSGNYRPKFEITATEEPQKSLEAIKVITDAISNGDYSLCRYAHLSACGQFASDPVKKWVIDVDDKSIFNDVKNHLANITTILLTLPTKNGFHFITTGFNPDLLNKTIIENVLEINKYGEYEEKQIKRKVPIFKDVEIKKDSPTILYTI
jgi:hypothetical protein